MKKLLTLLIILSFGTTWGQVKMRIDSAWTYTIQVKDLTDYQKECYDDSTLVAFETISNWKLDSLLTVKYGIPCYAAVDSLKGIYSHRQNVTFEGFIEYMKRKYKVK
jgi:hypothetical protein